LTDELPKAHRACSERVSSKEVQRISQNCAFSQESLERVVRPAVADGQRAPGLKFGDPRTMALFAALCLFSHLANGFTNSELRAQVADLLGLDLTSYTTGKMTYDLRRLRLKRIIYRRSHSNRYRLTSYGIKVSMLFTKLQARIFEPGFAALDQNLYPVLPDPLRKAFDQVNKELDRLIDEAAITLKKAA
jgi:hypothetical protein